MDEGENGVVARSTDPHDLADAILRVAAAGPSLRRSTGEWFRRNRARLSLDTSIETLLEIYRSESER